LTNYFAKKQIASYDIELNVAVSVCNVNYHILCSKCPLLVETTHASSWVRKSFTVCLMTFTGKAKPNQLRSVALIEQLTPFKKPR